MTPAQRRLGELMEGVKVKDPRVPILFSTGRKWGEEGKGGGVLATDGMHVRDQLVAQASCPVDWVGSTQACWEDGRRFFLECGAHVLLPMVAKTLERRADREELRCWSMSDTAEIQGFLRDWDTEGRG